MKVLAVFFLILSSIMTVVCLKTYFADGSRIDLVCFFINGLVSAAWIWKLADLFTESQDSEKRR